MQNKLQFMVPRMHDKRHRVLDVAEIIPVLLRKSVKGAWMCELTGSDANKPRRFNKNYWVMFDSLMGARGHLRACMNREIESLYNQIDAWYDRAEAMGIVLDKGDENAA